MHLRFVSSLTVVAAGTVLAAGLVAQQGQDRVDGDDDPVTNGRLEIPSAYERPGVHHARCRGLVLDPNDKPVAGARVILYGYVPFYWALPIAETKTDPSGRFEFEDVSGEGRLGLWVISPKSRPFAVKYRRITLVSGENSELPPLRLFEGKPKKSFKGRQASGVVRGCDGSPIQGAYVRFENSGDSFDPGAFAITDASGRFAIDARTGTPESMSVFLADCRIRVKHSEGVNTLRKDSYRWVLDLSGDLEIQNDAFTGYSLESSEKAAFSIWRAGTWHACGEKLWLVESRYGPGSAMVRVCTEGHLPLLRSLPDDSAEQSDSRKWASMRLLVRGADGPIANARVDVCLLSEEARASESEIARLQTNAKGAIATKGDPKASYAVYVYAPGFEAHRAVWRTSRPLDIILRQRTAKLRIGPTDDGKSIFVRRAGTFDPVAVVYTKPGASAEISLVPGRYEITRYGEKKAVAAIALDAIKGSASPAVTQDRRPHAVVRLPDLGVEGDWWVYAGRSAVGGMIRKWRAYSGGRTVVTRELVAEVKSVEDAERAFDIRFPTSGRYTVLCGHSKLDHRLFLDVCAEFGKSFELVVPELEASLKGKIADYPEIWGFGAQHGIAGPRLLLLPDEKRGTRWGVLVALPDPAEFTIKQLPPGHYSLHHHLYETEPLVSKDGVWGGMDVQLANGKISDVGELGKGGATQIEVHLVDRKGANLSGRLAIRDRMYESWAKVVERGTTLRYALDAIPTPPSIPIVDGFGTLENVRPGVFEFVFSLPDRHPLRFSRRLASGTTNRIELDVTR